MTLANVYEEKFVSPFERDTKEGAQKVLESIREYYPSTSRWVETDAYTEQLPNGKWRAVRIRKKIS